MSHPARIRRFGSPSAACGRRSLRTGVVIAGAMLMASTVANAQGAYGNANSSARDGLVQVRQVCETVVRLRPGEAHFDACVSSLAGSLNEARRDGVVVQPVANTEGSESHDGTSFDAFHCREQQACARIGFDPAFGSFTNCVLGLQFAFQTLDASEG